MTVVAATPTTWAAVPVGTIQVRGGRAKISESATPATNDWIALPDGTVYDLRKAGFVQVEKASVVIVSLDL